MLKLVLFFMCVTAAFSWKAVSTINSNLEAIGPVKVVRAGWGGDEGIGLRGKLDDDEIGLGRGIGRLGGIDDGIGIGGIGLGKGLGIGLRGGLDDDIDIGRGKIGIGRRLDDDIGIGRGKIGIGRRLDIGRGIGKGW